MTRHIVVCSAVVALLGVVLSAKGPTVKLTIAGPGLAQPIAVTSGSAIAPNIWMGDFYGAAANAPNGALPRYRVSFYAKDQHGAPELRYVVDFVSDPRTGAAAVYFPARQEEGYRLNVGTILRGVEGSWRNADPAWAKAVVAAIGSARTSSR